MRKFYSPINKLAEESTRPRGTGAEFMTELSKKPGFKQAEVEDRNLQALQSMPKMAREDFIANLKAQRPMMPEEDIRAEGDTHHDEYTLPGGSNYREILLQHPRGNFRGVREHFGGAPNVLASMRVKDRMSPEGKKILHIEEIQSDWHTKGHKHGYSPDDEDLHDTVKQAERAYHSLAAKRREASEKSRSAEIALASDKPLYQDPEVRARYTEALKGYDRDIMNLTPQVMKAEEAHRVAQDRVRNSVPDAPFKKNWHELALKRMIQHAAQKGYDEIHITPGAEQAARWGASGDSAKGFHDLYDKQLPQFLNKFGKQFGAQVGTSGLDVGGYKVNRDTGDQPYRLESENSPDVISRHATPDEAWAQAEKLGTKQMHSFPITPEMREHVIKNGMPLYADGGEVSNKEKFLEGSVIKNRLYHGTIAYPDTKNVKGMGDIHEFDRLFTTKFRPHSIDTVGNWFSDKPNEHGAEMYSGRYPGSAIYPVHVSIKNPYTTTFDTLTRRARMLANGVDDKRPIQQPEVDALRSWMKGVGHDGIIIKHDPKALNGSTEFQHQTAYVPLEPHQIKSAIGNRGTYDTNEPDITKAKGGAVKPVVHGIIKERVTVSPNLDAMQYELMSAKRFTKKVK